ncbi:GlxA family transcriptional regulator [Solicola gregarius]|uniref:GlxA family transcriptional regulator n=1 Tax=Solicola gregarius TaxID=2908642 RepID=A0AA46TJR2_9ACTN|nr:GlxA family transcriptional regulator [Solicola gregarius]UYM06365.1 GlxA family transcriptional regulator [Solicola gregarius]
MTTPRKVVVVGYDGAELVDIACVTTAFGLASRLGAEPAYQVRLASSDGGDIRSEHGVILRSQTKLDVVGDFDTLIVSGGDGHQTAAADAQLIRQVRRLAHRARRVASVCTGATILAACGLLDGRRATTHWMYADELAERYPKVNVDSAPIFIRDGGISTSGGVTASLDLTLELVAEDHGAELARWVALGMVTYLQRPGNEAQMSIFTTAPRPDHVALRAAIDYAVANPGGDLSVAALAAHAGVSARHLTRLFREHLDEPPGASVRRIRLEIAARMAATTDQPISQVAHQCGFGSAESMRQAFVTRFGVSPRTFRKTQGMTQEVGRAPQPGPNATDRATALS